MIQKNYKGLVVPLVVLFITGMLLVPFPLVMAEGSFKGYILQKTELHLFPYSEDNQLFGYVDLSGKWAIEPQFELATPFSEGLAAVSVNQKYGFIDKTGQMVIEPQFDYAADFSEGLAIVNLNQKSGYIDKTGQLVIEPQFDYANPFSEGLANVVIEGKTGFIDKTGRMIIEPQFDSESRFSEGLASVLTEGKTGFIDKSGRMIIAPQFDNAGDFSEGLASVAIEGKAGFIDKTGRIVIKPQFDTAGRFSEGLANVMIEGKTGFIDKTGQVVIKPQFDYAENFFEGLAAVGVEGKTGFINQTGQMVIQPQFLSASSFQDGLAHVILRNNAWGYIDSTGQILFQLPIPVPTVVSTQLIPYLPSVPTATKNGACFTHSLIVAGTFAWRCTIETDDPNEANLYDPCLTADDGQNLVCGADPSIDEPGFQLNLTEALPEHEVTGSTPPDDARAWLIQLANGATCNFATGAATIIDDKRTNYLCSDNSVILGNLQPGVIWTAEKAILDEKNPTKIEESKMMDVATIWQPVDPASVVKEIGLDPADVTVKLSGAAQTIQGHIRPAIPYDPTSPGLNGEPAHLKFTFDNEISPSWLDTRQRQLLIFPTATYEAMYQIGSGAELEARITTLQTLLKDRPQTITETIPVLPDLWAAQVIKAQIKYLDFEGGAGIRFITHYSHAASPIVDTDIFYTFQGLTQDGQYYISFFAPVSTHLLPDALDNPEGAKIFEAFAQDLDAYLAATTQTLNRGQSTDYTPDLAKLDALLQSLQIDK